MNAIRHWIFKVAYFGYNTSLGRRYWVKKLNDWHAHAASHNLTTHSVIEPMQYGRVDVVAIPIGFDNFSYLVRCEGVGILIDVGDPDCILSALNDLGVSRIHAVLLTHKHWDHQHGASTVASKFQGCVIYGGTDDFSNSSSIRTVNDGSELVIGNLLKISAISTPGHTSGHTCFLLHSKGFSESTEESTDWGCPDMLFCGDHLFLYGCGRVFESSGSVMLQSFEKLLSKIDDDTLVFPGHEYTLVNLQFTLFVLPDDQEILKCFEKAVRLRINHKKTCPETWAQQKRCNLFLRYKDNDLLKRLAEATGTPEEEATSLELFTMLRRLKDQFSNKPKAQDGSTTSTINPGQASISAVVARLQLEQDNDINSDPSTSQKLANSLLPNPAHECGPAENSECAYLLSSTEQDKPDSDET